MAYYFPFGGASATTSQFISYSLSTVSASVPLSTTTIAVTTSYAITSATTPPSGQPGTSITISECAALVTASGFSILIPYSGSQGLQGPTGSQGTANTQCPAGTIECINLTPSLSMALPTYPNGINATLPTGSRYSIVCMEIPAGCTTPACPDTLYTGSFPTIP